MRPCPPFKEKRVRPRESGNVVVPIRANNCGYVVLLKDDPMQASQGGTVQLVIHKGAADVAMSMYVPIMGNPQ